MSSIQINRMRNLIELTNAFTDKKITINIQLIESIEEGDNQTSLTMSFNGGTYVVKESYSDVMKAIKKSKDFIF
jgi:uncharacterized protein YlzI (FlbEa/FlbD family)